MCTITHTYDYLHTCKLHYTHMKQIMIQNCVTYILYVIDELRNLHFPVNIINYTFYLDPFHYSTPGQTGFHFAKYALMAFLMLNVIVTQWTIN